MDEDGTKEDGNWRACLEICRRRPCCEYRNEVKARIAYKGKERDKVAVCGENIQEIGAKYRSDELDDACRNDNGNDGKDAS